LAPILLGDLSSSSFAAIIGQIEMVMIPVGAHEQHGPALPVSTDTLSAQVLCALAGALMRPRVAVAPTIPWGVSWHHGGLPGTISLREETLMAIVEDTVTSLHRYGIDRFLVVNMHGGNNPALQIAVERCHRDHEVPVVSSIYAYSLIATAALDLLGPDAPGHAGGDEASVVLATRPDLVDLSQLGARDYDNQIRQVGEIVRSAGGALPIHQHKISRSGASGDSSGASAEAGSAILGRAAGQLQAIAESILDLDLVAFRPHDS
jgi:creatinine amidohydrolase